MKLSEMNTEQGVDVLCKVAEPIEHLATAEDFEKIVRTVGDAMHVNPINGYAVGIGKVIPFLLKEHKQDTMTIIAAMSFKTVEQVMKQPLAVTIKECKDFVDADFVRLFQRAEEQDIGE